MNPPYTSISPIKRSVYYGKRTMCVYDANGERVCVVQRNVGNRFISQEEAKWRAKRIAAIFNKYAESEVHA